jgi:aldose 1-epimerase
VVDGRYRFDGAKYQLDVNEPARHHALHGLVTWQRFDLHGSDSSSVVLPHRIVARPGYPFEVEVEVRYSLDDDGLTWAVAGHNVGGRGAPYGVSGHPYVVAPAPRVDGYLLQLHAERVMDVTPDRLIPRGVSSVSDLGLDFRATREIGPTENGHAFTAFCRTETGQCGLACWPRTAAA